MHAARLALPALSTSLVVPKKPKKVIGDQVAVSVVRDGIASANVLVFTWLAPAP